MTRPLVIKVTVAGDAPERCNQAFTVAASAVAAGVDVTVWLSGEATWFAVPGKAAEFELPLAIPLDELLNAIIANGSVVVCGQCAARRELTNDDFIEGIEMSGAATFAEQILQPDVQALVY